MINQVLRLFNREYKNLNRIEISKKNLVQNYLYLSALNKKVKIAPVIKSNAYGHGIIAIAEILDSLSPSFFCVDSLFESYELLKNNIKTPILVMGYTKPENLTFKKLPFSFAVFDLETAEILAKFQPGCGIHIFVDTGMNREGISLKQLPHFLEKVKKLDNLKVAGLMSHLASSTGKTDELFLHQIKNFREAKQILKKYQISPEWFHIAASGSLINSECNKIIAQVSNLARAGRALYGLENDNNLKPILKVITHIVQIKTIKKGQRIGYDGTFIAQEVMPIAILPIGYNDGVDRRLSNKGYFMIDRIKCKILGRVSMNITAIDLSDVPSPKVGQEVLVYSNLPDDPNSLTNVAKICQTITSDLITHLNSSIKRIIV